MYNKLEPRHYSKILDMEYCCGNENYDERYYLATLGCGCCEGHENFSREEFLQLLNSSIEQLQEIKKRVEECTKT